MATTTTTKPAVTRSRNWCFTWNNPSIEDVEYISTELINEGVQYLVYGREVAPATGTPHLQGQIVFKNHKEFSTVRKLLGFRIHIEPTFDLEASIKYCKKDGDIFEYGKQPTTKAKKGEEGHKGGAIGGKMEQDRWINALESAKRGKFDDICPQIQVVHCRSLDYIHGREQQAQKLDNTFEAMLWFVGPTGTGKSRSARERFPDHYIKNTNKWWDGYNGQEVAIIDDLDPKNAEHMEKNLKNWADHYPFTAERKGSSMTIRPQIIVVTSNYTIRELFPDPRAYEAFERRFEVWRFAVYGDEPTLEAVATSVKPGNVIQNPWFNFPTKKMEWKKEQEILPPPPTTPFCSQIEEILGDSDDEEEERREGGTLPLE